MQTLENIGIDEQYADDENHHQTIDIAAFVAGSSLLGDADCDVDNGRVCDTDTGPG